MKLFLIHCLAFTVLSSVYAIEWDKDHMHPTPSRSAAKNGKAWTADWKELDRQRINEANERIRRIKDLDKPAKNVIFMMGDGLGVSTVTATRFYLSQMRNLTGPDAVLAWEKMPHASFSKTYATDFQTSDSAATATAMVCGEKTGNDIIACSQDAVYNDCSTQAGTEIPSVLHHAIDAGKWTGVISTARVTHASPACTYAHAVNRGWEADGDLPASAVGICADIASQFIDVEKNQNIRVMLGGGRENFLPDDVNDHEYPDEQGERTDGRNLVDEWLQNKVDRGIPVSQYDYVFDQEGFDNIDPEEIEYLFGLFEPSHMLYELDRENEPSLAELVEKSIRILEKSTEGYFLFVEGGRVDHAHHNNNAQKAMGDALALSDAVQRAMDLTNETDTLIILTADHSHVFTFAGYPQMGTNIFQYDPEAQIAEDDKPFATLGYTNGPGFYRHRTADGSLDTEQPRLDQSEIFEEMTDKDYEQDAAAPLGSETHGGEDVGIFAQGPMAHLFMGTQEQSYIGNVMMYALCVGDNTDLCDNPPPPLGCPAREYATGNANQLKSTNSFSVLLLVAITSYLLIMRNH